MAVVMVPKREVRKRAGWTVPSARERLLSSRSSLKKRGVKDFGDVVGEVGAATAKATQTAVSPASRVRARACGARGRGNPGTENDRDVVPTPQSRQGAGGQPHDRDHVQPSGGLSRRGHRQRTRHPDEAGRAGARHPALGTRRQGDQWILPHRAVRGGHRRAAQRATPTKSVPGSTSRSSTPTAAAPSWRWKKAHQGTTPSPRFFAKRNKLTGPLPFRFMRPASGGLYGQARTANHPQNRRTMSTRQLVEPARPVV